ncbi:MAG: FliM/FliN family flagellar motor switch protein [Phycisphaerae bacterium]
MFSQDDIDAVLNDAEQAVNSLADQTDALTGTTAAPAAPASRTVPLPSESDGPTHRSPTRPGNVHRILRLRVPVVVRLAECTMSVGEIMRMSPGSIIEFDRPVEAVLDLLVNNVQIGAGEAIKAGEHFGLRITNIGDLHQKIESLAGD